MVHLKDYFFSSAEHVHIYPVKCEETPYTRRQLLSEMSIFRDFMEQFNCSLDELCEILDIYGITDKSLFDYTIFGKDYLIGKDYLYTIKYEMVHGYMKQKKTYYDLYMCHNTYACLALNTVARELVKRRFPFLTLPPFTKVEKRFKESIKNIPNTLKAKVRDIDAFTLFDNDLTIGELIKLYTEENYADSVVETPLYSVYSDSCSIYITIDESKGGWTLSLKISDLLNKDWKAIEERHVSSICLYDEKGEQIKGKWFEGNQKDAPYFNNPLVKELKRFFTK